MPGRFVCELLVFVRATGVLREEEPWRMWRLGGLRDVEGEVWRR